MASIKSRHTNPEMAVRSALHKMGFRFRLHGNLLPGKPDLVFPGRHAVIFVNGCFWHRHACRRGCSLPTTNTDAWVAKFKANTERDLKKTKELRKRGWRVHVVWECKIANGKWIDPAVKYLLKQSGNVLQNGNTKTRVLRGRSVTPTGKGRKCK